METKIEKARRIRSFIEKMSLQMDDLELLEAPEVCPYWKVGENVEVGERRFFPGDNKLYKVILAHTTQENWTPNLTPALWAVVAPSTEDGTLEHPITASRGMEYIYGLYYLDPEDSNIYLCERVGEIAGTAVILQYMPHELIGLYFVLVE